MSVRAVRSRIRKWLRPRRQRAFLAGRVIAPTPASASVPQLRVLVIGIYLSEHANQVEHLARSYAASSRHHVDQVWARIGSGPALACTDSIHHFDIAGRIPKFILLNRILGQCAVADYDHVLISDDDITVQDGFLDAYLSWVVRCGFSIAQPARARHSYKSHRIVLQRRWARARQTRFVEIGPVFSFDRRAAARLLPFDESSPMGWGYDLVWPVIAERDHLQMGIVDATPVDHSYRGQAHTYSGKDNRKIMDDYLARNPHLDADAARVTIKRYR